ncbi:MAG: tRNA (N6-isopentenyl adenosine(37)-C2)-methylthiotransferase MiaB [Candidatus Poribacteria bacterium]|nr:tRNA (N6-isopentenyl adenosine(37)-C2)-methylthiotransferase MiaB [Candidatus Poribacteria bacterium]MDE0504659.1 tRNA (N6-isopentenyl adenosine(37)-C2)-methylthiotransferase MiaB [Candidatus Poribacteria bacterium]
MIKPRVQTKNAIPLYQPLPISDPIPPSGIPQARRIYIETYGCQMNVSDSELMTGVLTRSGHHIANRIEDADVILLNTCAIRENAETKVINRLTQLSHRKRKQDDLILGVCGCMAQHLRTKLVEAAPYVDLVMGPDAYRDLPRAINSVAGGDPFINLKLDKTEDYADIAPIRKDGLRAWLTIQRGCDKMCTFCIVPFVRGRERSIPLAILVDDVKRLVDEGFKEIVLLGQTVNSYDDGKYDFGDLLFAVGDVEGVERVRFTSPHPSDASSGMIDAMANCAQVCKHIHLPLQSGSTRILKEMHRTYTAEEYRTLVVTMRERVPNLAISTDIIVGFCGETEQDFMETCDLMSEIRYDSAFTFKYSPREGTLAHRSLEDDVSEEEKGERLRTVIELQEKVSREINQESIGKTVEVLVEGESRRQSDNYQGKTDNFKTTVFPKENAVVGDIVEVGIEAASAHTLVGSIAV